MKERAILAKSAQGMFKPPYTGVIIRRWGQHIIVIRDGRKSKEIWSYRLWRKLK
jgi:hypothetical protein